MSDFEESSIVFYSFGTPDISPSPSPAPVSPDSEHAAMVELMQAWEQLLASWRAEDASRALPEISPPPSAGDLDDPRPWQPILSVPLLEEMSELNHDMTDEYEFDENIHAKWLIQGVENLPPFTASAESSVGETHASEDWDEATGFGEIDVVSECPFTVDEVEEVPLYWENEVTVGWLLDE